jgi:ABC-type branched-subunit amino acid transport system substrate-binding protein
MQMKLKLTVLAAVASFAGLSFAQDMVVKIGHVGPISGSIAHLGKDNENGAKMAVDELNAKGVVNLPLLNVRLSHPIMRPSIAVPRPSFSQTAWG